MNLYFLVTRDYMSYLGNSRIQACIRKMFRIFHRFVNCRNIQGVPLKKINNEVILPAGQVDFLKSYLLFVECTHLTPFFSKCFKIKLKYFVLSTLAILSFNFNLLVNVQMDKRDLPVKKVIKYKRQRIVLSSAKSSKFTHPTAFIKIIRTNERTLTPPCLTLCFSEISPLFFIFGLMKKYLLLY